MKYQENAALSEDERTYGTTPRDRTRETAATRASRDRNTAGVKIMVSLFDKTTVMAQPWHEAGYLCYCVDLQHPFQYERQGNLIKVGADVQSWNLPDGDIAFMAAFPPCTDLASSGCAWFKRKGLRSLIAALQLFSRAVELAESIAAPYMIENPISTVSTYYRKPDFKFDPADYAALADNPDEEAYTKKTCLWTGNGFQMPTPAPVPAVLGSKMHRLGQSKERANIRSATPQGFARAVFRANHHQ